MAGHKVRLIDIEADRPIHVAFDSLHSAASAAEFADKVLNAVRDHHGAPGQVFVERQIGATSGGFAAVRTKVNELSLSWMSDLQNAPDGQITRVARRFSTIAVAGTLATNIGLKGWDRHKAEHAAEQALLDWCELHYAPATSSRAWLISSSALSISASPCKTTNTPP